MEAAPIDCTRAMEMEYHGVAVGPKFTLNYFIFFNQKDIIQDDNRLCYVT